MASASAAFCCSSRLHRSHHADFDWDSHLGAAGYALLFESMLDSVLEARDRFLKPGGAVLPDVARIFVAGAGEGATGLGFWKDVYGLSMGPVAESLRRSGEPGGDVFMFNCSCP